MVSKEIRLHLGATREGKGRALAGIFTPPEFASCRPRRQRRSAEHDRKRFTEQPQQ